MHRVSRIKGIFSMRNKMASVFVAASGMQSILPRKAVAPTGTLQPVKLSPQHANPRFSMEQTTAF